MHKTPNLAQLSTPRRVQARTVAISWPLARSCRGQGRPCRKLQAAVSQPLLARPALCSAPTPCHVARLPSSPSRAPCLSYRGPSGHVVGAGCAPVLPYRRPCRAPGWPCRGLSRDTVQPHAPQPQSRYTPVYRDTPPPTAKLPP